MGNKLLSLNPNEIKKETYEFTKARVISVHDGDTFTIIAKHLGKYFKFTVRLYGIDCYELRDDKGIEAKEFTSELILNKIINIQVLNNKQYNGKLISEKYNRLLAIVTINGKDLAEELIKNSLGYPYFGKTKRKSTI